MPASLIRFRSMLATVVGVLGAMLAFGCAQPRPVTTPAPVRAPEAGDPMHRPSEPALQPSDSAPSSSDFARQAKPGDEVEAGPATGPGVLHPSTVDSAPGAGAPPGDWKVIDSGRDETGRVQPCAPGVRFTTIASLLAKPVAGPVAVRGRVWLPAVYPCTTGIPEACFATPVMAPARPTYRNRRGVFLVGDLAPNEPLACVGMSRKLRCPIPVDGHEYGVTGTLRIEGYDEAPLYELEVDRICRLPARANR